MGLTNKEKLELITKAKNQGYRGSYLDLFKQAGRGPRSFQDGGVNDPNSVNLNPAITNVGNIYQSPEYRNRLSREYQQAHGITLTDAEIDAIVAQNMQNINRGGTTATTDLSGLGLPETAVGYADATTGEIGLSNKPSMHDPYYDAFGIRQGDMKTTQQSAAEHEIAHRANSGPNSAMTSARENPLNPELGDYYSTFFTNAPEGNPYNPNTTGEFSEYATQPLEIKSQKKQLELALQDAGIWDPTQGEFTQEHVDLLKQRNFKVTGEGLGYMAEGLNMGSLNEEFQSFDRYYGEDNLYKNSYGLGPEKTISPLVDQKSSTIYDDGREVLITPQMQKDIENLSTKEVLKKYPQLNKKEWKKNILGQYKLKNTGDDLIYRASASDPNVRNIRNDQQYLRDSEQKLNTYLLEGGELPDMQLEINKMHRYTGGRASDKFGKLDDELYKKKVAELEAEGFDVRSDDLFMRRMYGQLQENRPVEAEAMQWVQDNPLTEDNAAEWHKKYKSAQLGMARLKEMYRHESQTQGDRFDFNRREEERQFRQQYEIDKQEFENNQKEKEQNLIDFMNNVAMEDPFDNSDQVAKHGGFAKFFACDYGKYKKGKRKHGGIHPASAPEDGGMNKPLVLNPDYKEFNPILSERQRYRNFLMQEEAGKEYMQAIDSAVKKPDGSYYKAFEDGLYYPYIVDGENEATIGYGRKRANVLKDYAKGITEDQALQFMDEDIDNALRLASIYVEENEKSPMQGDVGAFGRLDSATQYMLADYPYNVGKLSKFPKFANAVLTGDAEGAEAEYKRVKDKSTNIPLKRNVGFYRQYVYPFIQSTKE